MSEVFVRATREAFRYSSIRGELTTEQLWSLPLTHTSGFSLDAVGRGLVRTVKEAGEESLVETKPNPERDLAAAKLDAVKHIIATKQAEAKEAEKRVERDREPAKLLDALQAPEHRKLSGASKDELLKRLAELDS